MYVACMLCSVIVFFNRVFVKLKKYDLFIITLGCPIEQHAIVLLIPKSKFQFAVIIFFFNLCVFAPKTGNNSITMGWINLEIG